MLLLFSFYTKKGIRLKLRVAGPASGRQHLWPVTVPLFVVGLELVFPHFEDGTKLTLDSAPILRLLAGGNFDID